MTVHKKYIINIQSSQHVNFFLDKQLIAWTSQYSAEGSINDWEPAYIWFATQYIKENFPSLFPYVEKIKTIEKSQTIFCKKQNMNEAVSAMIDMFSEYCKDQKTKTGNETTFYCVYNDATFRSEYK